MELAHLKTFYYVALEGSVKDAEAYLGIKSSFISKQLKAIEQDLGVKLFTRHHKGLAMTEAGRTLFHYAQKIYATVDDIEQEFLQEKGLKRRTLRVLTTSGLTSLEAVKILKLLIDRHPRMHLSVNCVTPPASIRDYPAEFAILPDPCPEQGIVNEKFKTLTYCLYASQEYLDKHGTPKGTADLLEHNLLSYKFEYGAAAPPDSDMHVMLARRCHPEYRPKYHVNSSLTNLDMCLNGFGIIFMQNDHELPQNLGLVKVLPDKLLTKTIYLSYEVSMQNSGILKEVKKIIEDGEGEN